MKGRVHSIDYLVMSEDASSPNEAQTANTGSILGMKNRPLTTALGFTATLRVPDNFAPTEDKVATVMHWRGLFVSLIFFIELELFDNAHFDTFEVDLVITALIKV